MSFGVYAFEPRIPLWILFLAVQLLDFLWAPLVLSGIERVRIVPGITASNPLDLYYMPYTHSLVAAIFWSLAAAAVFALWHRKTTPSARAALLVALAVFSQWLLDFVVHRPDLPLYDDVAKVGLGLWNWPAFAFMLEAGLLLGGMALVLRGQARGLASLLFFGLIMLGVQAVVFFGPPLGSGPAAAVTALAAYAAFAWVIAWWERRHWAMAPPSST